MEIGRDKMGFYYTKGAFGGLANHTSTMSAKKIHAESQKISFADIMRDCAVICSLMTEEISTWLRP